MDQGKIVRFKLKGQGVTGPAGTGAPRYGLHRGEYVRVIVASPFEGMIVGTSEAYDVEDVQLLVPCVPTKIVCVGLNYRDHAKELNMPVPNEPLIFLKPPSALIGHGAEIVLPEMSDQVEHEAELAAVIGKRAKNVSPDEAHQYILGYTCLNDVTARDLQRKDVQFTRSKSFDSFCPMGPWIDMEFVPADQKIQCLVNGETRQDSTLGELIHTPHALLSFISHIMTLEPGDVIATGTPKGVSALSPGDECSVAIEGLGELKNRVIKE